VLAALVAAFVCIGLLTAANGFSSTWLVRLAQAIAVFGIGALIVGGAVVLALVRLAGWRDPASEADFDALVERSERLAADEHWDEDDGDLYDFDAFGDDDVGLDPTDEDDFRLLVRSALDELPIEFHRALEHVAVVIADNGASVGLPRGRRGAYGLYQGDTFVHDFFHDRIVIFRDTLVRDFGHDPEMLRAQVTRTVRHELAHHLGWDEKGVRGLGL
jgi:predicted Zn-dependent protease with MMP-like domain